MKSLTAHTRKRSEYRDFLAAITASPLDDGVRLVFADWLDEQGDIDRAAYIRMEVERASLPEYDDRALWLRYEADVLLQRHRREWLIDLPEWLRREGEFERGLPGGVSCSVGEFLQHAADDWTCVPIHDLTLWAERRGSAPALGDLWTCPKLRQLVAFSLVNLPLDSADIRSLADGPHLAGLRKLSLCRIGSARVEALANTQTLAALTELRLIEVPLGRSGAEALARAPFLPNLTTLDLSENELDADAVRALLDGPVDGLCDLDLSDFRRPFGQASIRAVAHCPRLAGLRRLDLGCDLRAEAELFALAESPFLTGIEHLRMSVLEDRNENITLDTLRAVADAPLFRNLRQFKPWHWLVGDEVARFVADWPALSNVRDLAVCCEMSSAGLEALLASPFLKQVNVLDLSHNQFGDVGVAKLAESDWLPRLRVLSLRETGVGADGVRELASADVSRLLRVSLDGNPLEDAGAIALSASRWPAVRELSLNHSSIGSAGATALASEGMFPNLVWLLLSRNQLGPAGAEAIANGSGLARLLRLELDGNEIGDAGARALTMTHRRLAELDVECNGISEDVARELENSPAMAGTHFLMFAGAAQGKV